MVRYLLENWSGTVNLFTAALVKSADAIHRRPQSKKQFEWLFPKNIGASKPSADPQSRFTDLDPPKQPTDFFTDNDITRSTVWQEAERIWKTLSDAENPIRGVFGRNHEDAAMRLLSVTSVNYSGRLVKKQLWTLIGSAYLEPLVMKSYISDLLCTSAGLCRRQLEESLSSSTNTGHWRFIDWYEIPAETNDGDGTCRQALHDEAYQAKVDLDSIQSIVRYVEQRDVSRSLDKSKVDVGVSDALKVLVMVMFLFVMSTYLVLTV